MLYQIINIVEILFIIGLAGLSPSIVISDYTASDLAENIMLAHSEDDRVFVIFRDNNHNLYGNMIQKDSTEWYVENKSPNQFIKDVHAIPSISDGDYEVFKSFNETIIQGGDCEDSSLVLARGLYDMGFDTAIILFENHAMVGINSTQVDTNYLGISKHIYSDDTRDGQCVIGGYYLLESTAPINIGCIPSSITNSYITKIYCLKFM